MRVCIATVLIAINFLCNAQDHIFFLNGNEVEGKLKEIGISKVIIQLKDGNTVQYEKNQILLIEFKNGKFESFNRPKRDVTYSPKGTNKNTVNQNSLSPDFHNLVYINTLALCNSDISVFYERLNRPKNMGLGLMAAINFNKYAVSPNLWIELLNNAKKKFDLGAFINFYPKTLVRKTTISYGAFLKYMAFDFSSVEEQASGSSSVLVYTPASSFHLATMLTLGIHTSVTKNFFLRSSIGLGGFFLHGIYKEQYNYVYNENGGTGTSDVTTSFLLKGYISINAGYNF